MSHLVINADQLIYLFDCGFKDIIFLFEDDVICMIIKFRQEWGNLLRFPQIAEIIAVLKSFVGLTVGDYYRVCARRC